MATKSLETRASECFQKGQYDEAIKHYTLCLSSVSQTASKDTKATLLFNRSSCYLKQKLFENVVEDCSTILKFDTKNTRAYARKIKALCNGLGRFSEAHQTAKRWYAADSQNAQAKKEVERLEIILNAMKEQDEEDDDVLVSDRGDRGDGEERTPPEGKEADPDNISLNVTTSSGNISKTPLQIKTSLPGTLQNGSRNNDNTDSDSASSSQSSVKSDNTAKQLHCVPCSMEFKNNEDLDVHLSSEVHRQSVSLEEDKNWKFRPPPRGLTSEEYTICPRQQTSGTCKYGTRCTHAHSDAELVEWKQRFDYRRHNSTSSGDQVAVKRSYAELLMEKWIRAENKDAVMKEAIENVKVHVNSDLTVTMSTKRCTNAWTFTLTSRDCLHRIILLDDASRAHYSIGSVTVGPKKSQKIQKVEDNCVEWTNPSIKLKGNNENVYRIKIVFKAEIFGTFRQSVVFDFGSEPVLYQQLCVDATPVSDIEKLQQDLIISEKGRWDLAKLEIIQYKPSPFPILDGDRQLLENYQPPVAEELRKSPSIAELNLSAENYRQRMHDLLYIEEMAQYASIARYNVKTALQIVDKFILLPANNATAKYAVNGELFARMKLNTEISEDTSHGRLILQTVNTVLLAPFDPKKKNKEPDTVYEAMVEEKGKDFIMVRISKECVQELGLKPDKELNAEVQFQLNRLPVCEMHHAIDKLQDVRLVFPDLDHSISIPWTPRSMGRNLDGQWSDKLDARLNTKQKEAIVAMTTSLEIELPPILLVGPYGTGKTFTLAQAAKQILQQEGTRILICTHSNSAADLYIKDYFHPYVEDNHLEAKPLRIYYRNRWIQTVNETVQKYCLIDPSFNFRMPTKEDIEGHRVIVATLSTSKYLYDIGLESDCFTHILLDEAAQALECETIMPLAVASKKTRIVLAGDHMQMSPEVHSDFTRGRNLHISLLERLYDLYPGEQPCKILLCENYRSHKAILDYTSELFYDNKLVAGSKQPRHEVFYPLSFFTAKGEDVQHQNSTAFYNNAEVYEIVERISELKKMWPKSWGSQDDGAIGVVSPYADQVVRIRSELRKRKMGGVSVERVFNVQGKQFRAIFLSTVRTRNTCSTDTTMEDFMDFGFLSNAKLLTTAITRAQSLVAVVGDPVSLCSIGKCRKIWERFIEVCNQHNSLYGMTWSQLRLQLDGVELKKTYVLNPLAPEFVPNRLRHGDPLSVPEGVKGPYGHHFTGNALYKYKQQQQQMAAALTQPYLFSMPPTLLSHPYYMVPPYMTAHNRARGTHHLVAEGGRGTSPGSSPVRSPPRSESQDKKGMGSPRSGTPTPKPDDKSSKSASPVPLGLGVNTALPAQSFPLQFMRPGMVQVDYRALMNMYRMQGPMSPGQGFIHPQTIPVVPPRVAYPFGAMPPHLRPHGSPPGMMQIPTTGAAQSPPSSSPLAQRTDATQPPGVNMSPGRASPMAGSPRSAPQFTLLPNVKHVPPHLLEQTQQEDMTKEPPVMRYARPPDMEPYYNGTGVNHHIDTARQHQTTLQQQTPEKSYMAEQFSQQRALYRQMEQTESSEPVSYEEEMKKPPWLRRRQYASLVKTQGGDQQENGDASPQPSPVATPVTRQDSASSDILAPSEIDNVVKFITDDASTESELGNIHIGHTVPRLKLNTFAAAASGAAAAVAPPKIDRQLPLYMRGSPQLDASSTSTPPPTAVPESAEATSGSTTPQLGQLTYASVLRRQTSSPSSPLPHRVEPRNNLLDPPNNLLPSPVSPTTPATFQESWRFPSVTSPTSAEPENNPLELLKNLNIRASPATQAMYNYFS